MAPEATDTLIDRVRAVLADTLGRDAAEIDADASSDTLEGWDSLAHQNILLALGRAFAISFSAEEGDGTQDLPSLARIIGHKLGAGSGAVAAGAPVEAIAAVILPPPVVVLSDSSARTFAYDAAFLPLSIGQGARVNLLTPENARAVEAKIDYVLSLLPPAAPVALALHGSHMHHFRNTYGTGTGDAAAEAILLGDVAQGTAAVASRIRERTGRKVVVIAAPPLAAEGYAESCAVYNAALRAHCRRFDVPYIDVADDVLADGALKPAYWADTWHLAPAAAALYAEALRPSGLTSLARAGAAPWRYRYLIPAPDSAIDIWGDFPPGDLVLDPPDADFALTQRGVTHSQSFRWDRYHRHTNFIEDCVASIRPAFAAWQSAQGRALDVTILDCGEGLPAFVWDAVGTGSLRGVDRGPVAIARANEIKALAGKPAIQFTQVAGYGHLDTKADAFVVLEHVAHTDDYLSALFAKLHSLGRAVFFRTDAASHARLLNGAGFAQVFELPIAPADGAMEVPGTRKTARGRWTEARGYRLLAAFADEPGTGFRAAMADHLSTQRAAQMQRLASDMAGLFDPMIAALKR